MDIFLYLEVAMILISLELFFFFKFIFFRIFFGFFLGGGGLFFNILF